MTGEARKTGRVLEGERRGGEGGGGGGRGGGGGGGRGGGGGGGGEEEGGHSTPPPHTAFSPTQHTHQTRGPRWHAPDAADGQKCVEV